MLHDVRIDCGIVAVCLRCLLRHVRLFTQNKQHHTIYAHVRSHSHISIMHTNTYRMVYYYQLIHAHSTERFSCDFSGGEMGIQCRILVQDFVAIKVYLRTAHLCRHGLYWCTKSCRMLNRLLCISRAQTNKPIRQVHVELFMHLRDKHKNPPRIPARRGMS